MPNRAHPLSDPDVPEIYSVPSKVFVLGEYAVLAHLPAVIATLPPRFRMRVFGPGGQLNSEFAKHSPLGRLNQWARQRAEKLNIPELQFGFEDPLRGAGGFGASTAQFAMAYLAYSQRDKTLGRQWREVWGLYRELMNDGPLPPSGADLIAQWQGGVVKVELPGAAGREAHGSCTDVWPLLNWSSLLCFSTTEQPGRKVPTHNHLQELTQRGFPQPALLARLEVLIQHGIEAIHARNVPELGVVMSQTAEVFAEFDLEIQATREDRLVLRELPGVLGVKGSGALQSDAILVLMSESCSALDREKVIEVAQKRGLVLMADGLTAQMGVERVSRGEIG